MSTKSFTGVRKPVRQPTPEQIATFEETGRAIAQEKRIAAKAEKRKHRNAEISEGGNTESRARVNEFSRNHINTENHESVNAPSQNALKTESSRLVKEDMPPSEAIVRLTIDLAESTHTRFKAGCAMTKRRMVEEVREFIERRTVELERECGLALTGPRRIFRTNQKTETARDDA